MYKFKKIWNNKKEHKEHYDLHQDIWIRCMAQLRLDRIEYEKRNGIYDISVSGRKNTSEKENNNIENVEIRKTESPQYKNTTK